MGDGQFSLKTLFQCVTFSAIAAASFALYSQGIMLAMLLIPPAIGAAAFAPAGRIRTGLILGTAVAVAMALILPAIHHPRH